jgi:hypothetical protein
MILYGDNIYMYLPYKYKKLDINFDHHAILAEVQSLGDDVWTFHGFHGTGHKVLRLYSTNGTLKNQNGKENHSLVPPFLPTDYLERMPYTASVLDAFGVSPCRTRFAELAPGAIITPHRDLHPNWFDKVRLHIPIVTHPDVKVHVWGRGPELRADDLESIHMAPGEAWVFNIWDVHAVTNVSDVTRIHLVADFQPQGRLFDLMFRDSSKDEILTTMGYRYPRDYRTDAETMDWLTGGQPEIGKRLWNAHIVDTNPQVGGYSYPEQFWDKSAY